MSFTKKLYKKAKNQKLQTWTIEVDGNKFRTTEGYVDGALSCSAWTRCEGKNIGKSHESSPEDQAIKEAKSKVAKLLKKDWSETIEGVDAAKRQVLPQLAKKYEDEIDRLIALGEPLAIQPKLDGIRALGSEDAMISKEGGIHGPTSSHIHELTKALLAAYPQVEFTDGEFYNHEFKADFNKICSIVKKQNPSLEEEARAVKYLQYHLYDLNVKGMNFKQRYNLLTSILKNMKCDNIFVPVSTVFIPIEWSKEDVRKILDDWHSVWVREGYEGSMIRTVNSNYQMSRVKDLLKRKDWIDDEFDIVDILSGRGNKMGIAASVICRDERGEEFSVGIIGDEKYCKELLLDKFSYIGKKKATVKYQNLTPDRKVPRFGKMKAVRDYE